MNGGNLKKLTFKQWDHLDSAEKSRRIEIALEKLNEEVEEDKLGPRSIYDGRRWEGMNAHAIFCVAARLDGDLELAQEMLDSANPYSAANTRYATWVKFKRLIKPYRSILALAHKPNLVDDTKQLLANDLGLDEELQLELTRETNPQLVGDVGANPCATVKTMEAVSEFKNVIARARLAENPGLSIDLMQKLLKDKQQAHVGLAKNWMIPDSIRQDLFETLDPEVVGVLVRRHDADKKGAISYALRAIEKHATSAKFDIQRSVEGLKLWLIDQPEVEKTVWEPFIDSQDEAVFSAALRRLPVDEPGLETILEKNLDRYSSTDAVVSHPGLSDKLIDKIFDAEQTVYRMRPLLNPHISKASVKKLVKYGEEVISTALSESLERIEKGWLPSDLESVIRYFYKYINAGGRHELDRIQANISLVETKSNSDLNPNSTPSYYVPPALEITDEILEKYRNRGLGYQDPEIPQEWLLKNVKNRSDEIKKDVLLNPSLPVEAMKILSLDKKPEIRKALGLLPNCPDDLKALVALQ
jgi:hypothetical protein